MAAKVLMRGGWVKLANAHFYSSEPLVSVFVVLNIAKFDATDDEYAPTHTIYFLCSS